MQLPRFLQSSLFRVFVLALFVSLWIRIAVIPYASVLWDEAVFISWIWEITSAIKTVNIHAFMTNSFWQIQYPPLQSWILGALLTPFHFTIHTVRLMNLLWFVASALLIYILGRQTATSMCRKPSSSNSAGFITALFFIFSPLVIFLSSVALKEVMSAFFSILTMILYFRARKTKRMPEYIYTAMGLLLLFMTKYQYGVFLAATLGLEGCISFINEKNKTIFVISHLSLILPMVLFGILWVFYPQNRLDQFLGFVLNNSGITYTNNSADAITYALFYPRALLYFYSGIPIIGILILAVSTVTLRFLHRTEIRTLWIGFTLVTIMLATHTNSLQERYLITVIPYLFALSAAGIMYLAEKLQIKNTQVTGIGILTFSLFMGVSIVTLPRIIYAVGSLSMKGIMFPQSDYKDTWFNYDQRSWPHTNPGDALETPYDIIQFIFTTIDATKPVYIAGALNEMSPPYIEMMRKIYANNRPTTDNGEYDNYKITISVASTSLYATRDYQLINAWREYEIPYIESDPALIRLATKTFDTLGVTVGIFGTPHAR